MRGNFSVDSNYRPTMVREGQPLGGFYKIPSSLGDGDWHLLMPSGNTGAVLATTVDAFNEKLNIGTLRADIQHTNISGWLLSVLNAGYQAHYRIGSYQSDIVHVGSLSGYENSQLALHNIQPGNAVEFVIFPKPINQFCLNYTKDSLNYIEIGWHTNPVWNDTEVISLGELIPGESMLVPIERIDRLVFKFTAAASSPVNNIIWGEQLIG